MALAQLVDAALAELGDGEALRPVVEKELLHYDILHALDRAGLLDILTFQGGTALRLCYGASRYSEDLDFVGGRDFAAPDLAAIAGVVEEAIGERYGLEVRVKEPSLRAEARGVAVSRWQVAVVTAPGRPDLPKQRIRIEVVNVPAYSGELRGLRRNYSVLPDGYEDVLVPVESLAEIMADKLVSLVVVEEPVRYRDLWDLAWLHQQGVEPAADWVEAKTADYGVVDYVDRLQRRLESLSSLVHGSAFAEQMGRFLPPAVIRRTLERPGFPEYVERTNRELLTAVREGLAGGPDGAPFRM